MQNLWVPLTPRCPPPHAKGRGKGDKSKQMRRLEMPSEGALPGQRRRQAGAATPVGGKAEPSCGQGQ